MRNLDNLKSMRVLIGRVLVLIFLIVAICIAVREKSFFAVQSVPVQVQVSDADRVAWQDLNTNVERVLKSYIGMSMWKVSLAEVRQKLTKFPQLKNLQVQKSWPQTLEVKYSLAPLKAIYQVSPGQYKILDDDGQWMGPIKWSRLPGLPWLKGEWPIKNEPLVGTLITLLNRLPQNGPLTSRQISEISFNELDGFLLTLIKTGQQIRFGIDNFEVKSLRVSRVLDYLQTRGLESRVIDANFSKKVLVRLRNHP